MTKLNELKNYLLVINWVPFYAYNTSYFNATIHGSLKILCRHHITGAQVMIYINIILTLRMTFRIDNIIDCSFWPCSVWWLQFTLWYSHATPVACRLIPIIVCTSRSFVAFSNRWFGNEQCNSCQLHLAFTKRQLGALVVSGQVNNCIRISALTIFLW